MARITQANFRHTIHLKGHPQGSGITALYSDRDKVEMSYDDQVGILTIKNAFDLLLVPVSNINFLRVDPKSVVAPAVVEEATTKPEKKKEKEKPQPSTPKQ